MVVSKKLVHIAMEMAYNCRVIATVPANRYNDKKCRCSHGSSNFINQIYRCRCSVNDSFDMGKDNLVSKYTRVSGVRKSN